MQEINLTLKVQTNASASPEEIAKLVQGLIDVGLSDAAATIESGEGDLQAAELATDLTIHAPVVAQTPRVLVVVSGGVADPLWEGDVEVEVFDWDVYKDDPDGVGGVPRAFASLAKNSNIPVKEEDEEDDSQSYSDGGLYSALGISSN